jgi:hypothetical protein
MKFINPQVKSTRVNEKSLIYHIDMARHLSHDMRHIVKNMSNKSEVMRIKKEKDLKEEMERLELQRLQEIEKSKTEDRLRHDAANRIASIYFFRQAKRVVRDRSVRVRVDKLYIERDLLIASATRIQKQFRLNSTNNWCTMMTNISAEKANPSKEDKGKSRNRLKSGRRGSLGIRLGLPKLDLTARLNYEIHQRRKMERLGMISEMVERYSGLCQMHMTCVQYWLQKVSLIPAKITRLEARRLAYDTQRRDLFAVPEESSGDTSVKRGKVKLARVGSVVNPEEVQRRELSLKDLHVAQENVDHLLDNLSMQQFWISQCVRSACRRLSFTRARYADISSRLAWVAQEQRMVARVLFHVDNRIRRFEASGKDSKLVVDWLRFHQAKAVEILTAFDAQQESLLLDEVCKLKADDAICTQIDLLLVNLYDSIASESQLAAERVFIDRKLLILPKGSDEAVRYSDDAFSLRRKQTNLMANVVDALKLALQEKLNTEDELALSVVAYPDDDPKLPPEKMPATIKAVLLEKFHATSHFQIGDFLNIFLIQPWLSTQAVGDVRIEDDITMKALGNDSMQVELKSLREKIGSLEADQQEVTKKLEELQEELDFIQAEPPKNMFSNANEENVAELIRQDTIQLFKQELKMQTMEKLRLFGIIDKMKSLIEPASARIASSSDEIQRLKEDLLKRAAERKRLKEIFFEIEEKSALELSLLVDIDVEKHQKLLADNNVDLAVCENWTDTLQLTEKYTDGTLSLIEINALNIPWPMEKIDAAILTCNASINPRLYSTPLELRTCAVETRKVMLETDQSYYKFIIEELMKELHALRNYKAKHMESEKLLLIFQQSLLDQRRQKSLQKELEERRNRLEDMRTIRIKTMRADRDALLAKKEKEQKRRDRKFAEELKNSKLVRGVNRAKRRAQNLRNNVMVALLGGEAPMDEEHVRMIDALAEHGKENLDDKAQGIRNIKLTVGDADTERFYRQMEILKTKKLPYYTRNEKSIGRQISVWVQPTFNVKQFITTINLGHTDSSSPHYKDLTSSNYEAVGHTSLKLVFWVKRDSTKLSGITSIQIAFSEDEETAFMQEGLELAGPSLFDFDLPDSTIWVSRMDKVVKKVDKMSTVVATNNIIRQLKEVRQMIEDHPANQNLKEMENRFIKDLELCYKKEEEAVFEDSIEAAKRLMALDDDEVESWIDVYTKLDKDKLGRITIDDIFYYLEEYLTESGRLIFTSVNAIGDDGYIGFGDFMLSIGTFCFFGEEEVLKFLYTYADTNKTGMITQSQYIDLLNDLHPFDKARAVRALRNMKKRATESITFDEFKLNHSKYPTMLFPQLRLQNAMRKKVICNQCK